MNQERQEFAGNSNDAASHGFTNAIVHRFLYSNLSIILIVLSLVVGAVALLATPREEDPQIVVPLADVLVSAPGHSAAEVEQLVATPLERLLYQIDGVEYVYSMSREGQAIITVRFFVGEDRERSLVKLFKKINENVDAVPSAVSGWVVKPVEIDDVPIVTLTLSGRNADDYTLRRVGEELSARLAAVRNVSRAYVIGGTPRVAQVYLDSQAMQAYQVSPLEIRRALEATNVAVTGGRFTRDDQSFQVDAGAAFASAGELNELVVAVVDNRPVLLKSVARVVDGPEEANHYVRHGWGPAAGMGHSAESPGMPVADSEPQAQARGSLRENAAHPTNTHVLALGARIADAPPTNAPTDESHPAVTIALAKKRGSNAVQVARDILHAAESLKREVVPDDIALIVTRNYGLTADEKVNELVEGLGVAVVIVVALLTLALGWRAALVVALAVPVVFGLTLMVNLLAGYTINRVTLFALILSLGLLVDDPIVDVENIERHFRLRKKATRSIVLEAVAEIRPPLINATLAVIVSFLPMFFITGMMGPYMRPMALNVPITMLMSMLVAFTITPWLAFHLLKKGHAGQGERDAASAGAPSFLERALRPLMTALLHTRARAMIFLGIIALLTLAAVGLAVARKVPLKMLPFDNKNELLLVLDFDEGTTLERADADVREIEHSLSQTPEVTDFVSYVGLASPMDFNGLVRHYYLRRGDHLAQIQVNLVGKKQRETQSHALGLRDRDELTRIAARVGARLKIVETPPGPPVIASVVAEVYGRPDHDYRDLTSAAEQVAARLRQEPGVREVDDSVENDSQRLIFSPDREKAALSGISVAAIAETVGIALGGGSVGTVRLADERNPLRIELRLPRSERSHISDLARVHVKGTNGVVVPLSELGTWRESLADKTVYHKNLERVSYVFAETVGRPPAEIVVDVQADRSPSGGSGFQPASTVRPLAARTYLGNGGGNPWQVPPGIRVEFAGEGEWQITLDVFRDLGLAFAGALVGLYILLVVQTGSFALPVVILLAIPLTILGVMPGFWLLNVLTAGTFGGYADPVYFTATAMIGMIALAGIVTRNSIILIDFIHLSLGRGRGLLDAIVESCSVRLRPILLTAGAALLSSIPITIDPIFSGLAWALIFGLVASTLFTLFVIPAVYWLIYANRLGHGVRPADEVE